MVLSYSVNHGPMSQKSYPGSGTTWEDCDKYARCGNFGELKRLKAKYPHLKTIISVGGWTWSNRFSDMAADEKQEKYSLNLQSISFANMDLTALI